MHKDVKEKTVSIWSNVLDNLEIFRNKDYVRLDEVLTVSSNTKDFQLWLEYYITWDSMLFEDPEQDTSRILTRFYNMQSKNIPSTRSTSRSATASFFKGSKSEENSEFSKWYDQQTAIMEQATLEIKSESD